MMHKVFEFSIDAHPNVRILLERLNTLGDPAAGFIVAFRETAAFWTYDFSNDVSNCCPFSIWIERGPHGSIFFMIGPPQAQATVLHYWDLSLETVFTDAMDTIDDLLCGLIQVNRIYCQDKLRKVEYKTATTEYSFSSGEVFVCLERKTKSAQCNAWAERGSFTALEPVHDDHHH